MTPVEWIRSSASPAWDEGENHKQMANTRTANAASLGTDFIVLTPDGSAANRPVEDSIDTQMGTLQSLRRHVDGQPLQRQFTQRADIVRVGDNLTYQLCQLLVSRQ